MLYKFPYGVFSARANDITRENMSDSYIIDPSTGEQYPMYIEVPCNHCAICKDRKRQAMVQRCKLETLTYDTMPWYVTLTYSNKYLPKHGVDKDDVQRFLKRFRINLVRNGYAPKIRYICSAEYGSPAKTFRPHYHMVIWNLPGYSMQQYLDVSNCLQKSWNMGIVDSRVMDSRDESCIYYSTKYLFKGTDTPKGKNPTFFLASNGNGGIGSAWLDSHANELLSEMNTKYKYLNRYSGKISDLVYDQYVLNRILPSYSRSVPSHFRRNLHEFSRLVNSGETHVNDIYKNKYNEYKDRYFTDVFDPYQGGTPLSCSGFDEKEVKMPLIDYLEHLVREIDRVGSRIDFAHAHRIADKRNLFLCKLFKYPKKVDIAERSYRARKRYALGRSTEVL